MQHVSYVLQDEYDNLLAKKQELERCYKEQSKRKREACEQSAETRHDNADYEDAEYQQYILGKRMNELQKTINNVKVILLKNFNDEKVIIGKTVDIVVNNQEFTYTIGGYPTIPGRISYISPLGKCLLNQTVGSIVTFIHEQNKKTIKILAIR